MEDIIETEETVEASDAWDAAFSDDVSFDTDGAETPPAEPEPDGAAEEAADTPDEGARTDEEPTQTYTLKVNGETRQVELDELIALGQKGLDYDRVKDKLSRYESEQAATESAHEAFLKELADADGLTVEELIDKVRAGSIASKEGIDQDRAMERVRYERRIRELQAQASAGQKTREEKEAEDRQKQGFIDFRKAYPDIKGEDIPNEVWQRVRDGMSLTDAWKIHEADVLRAENARLKEDAAKREQEQKNRARSAGSKNTSGKDTPTDLWDKYLS